MDLYLLHLRFIFTDELHLETESIMNFCIFNHQCYQLLYMVGALLFKSIAMADQEVIKHTKRVYKIWNNKEHSVWHKFKEFVIEIFIIVFAVSLSIYLHGKSEHKHDQAEVQRFLTGLKSDLQSDLIEIKSDFDSYEKQGKAFSYISSLKKDEEINKDSLNVYKGWIFNLTWLIPNNGRYEGFKASGNIDKIENEELRNHILDLYQELLPSLLVGTTNYVENKNELLNFIQQNRKRITDSTTNIHEVLKLDIVYNYSKDLSDVDQVLYRYQLCINKMTEIIHLIEEEYK